MGEQVEGGKKSFLLRLDARLWAQLQAWAADDLRSVNGQIEYLLREAVRTRPGTGTRGASPNGPTRGETGSQGR